MNVTIELKPEVERRLAEKAEEKGLKIETYIEVLIEESVNGKAESLPENEEKPFYETATKEEWLAEFHRWVDGHRDKGYPHLSDEALRRENIYEDRF